MTKKEQKYYFDKLLAHVGHSIEIAAYGKKLENDKLITTDIYDISVECIDCNEVLINFENNAK